MASVNVNLSCDLQHPVRVQYLDGNLFSMDNGGNTINIMVYDNGEPAEIGGSVTANVIRADGGTVTVSGAIDGNRAYVIMPQAAYAVPGAVSVIVKLTEGTTVTTIAAFVANVYISSTDETIDPGTIIPSIESLISEIEGAIADIPVGYNASFAPAYSTSKTYAVGQYVTYNGYLWRCTTAITSAESWTSGHWTQVALAEDVSNLKEFIDDNAEYTDSFIENQLGIREYLFLNDGGINTSGETINITRIVTPSNGSDWKCAVIPCSPGDIFYIKVYSAYSYYRPWAFVALDGTKISAATTGNVSAHVSAPENAAYLVSNAASFHDRKPTITKGESKIYQFENYLKGGFRRGDWRSDVPKATLSRDYRVRSQSQITYPYDIELIAEPGYSFYFHTYDGDDFRLQTVFSTHYATIPANTEFDITISADPLDTSVTADPEVYRKGVKVYRRRFETYAQNWQPLNRDKVRIEGHRGWMGDTANYPENSIPAFEKAAQMGVWMIETDIQETSDGYFVCMHDSTVNRTTDGTGTIASKTLEEVQALHLIGGDGTLKVPTLEQYLRICKIYNIVCHIEIKSVNDEKTSIPRIIKAVEAYGLLNQTSYNPHTLTAADIIRQNVYFAPIHLLVETTSEKWATFEERVNACECMGSIRCGTDDFGNVANAYKEQIAEIHARGMIAAKMSGSWDAQKAYLGVGFDLCVSNSNLTIPT